MNLFIFLPQVYSMMLIIIFNSQYTVNIGFCIGSIYSFFTQQKRNTCESITQSKNQTLIKVQYSNYKCSEPILKYTFYSEYLLLFLANVPFPFIWEKDLAIVFLCRPSIPHGPNQVVSYGLPPASTIAKGWTLTQVPPIIFTCPGIWTWEVSSKDRRPSW